MKIKDLVCGVEISAVLEDLGFNEISYFCWRWDRDNSTFVVEPYVNDERSKTRAYLVSELLRILPKKITSKSNKIKTIEWWMRIEPDDVGWNVCYFDDSETNRTHDLLVSINDENLAQCLADCLAWLIKDGHVKVKEPQEVYCHGCSESSGADLPVYHLPLVCK